eukprot:352422-Chlamydomonas_euryale.AAC.3
MTGDCTPVDTASGHCCGDGGEQPVALVDLPLRDDGDFFPRQACQPRVLARRWHCSGCWLRGLKAWAAASTQQPYNWRWRNAAKAVRALGRPKGPDAPPPYPQAIALQGRSLSSTFRSRTRPAGQAH